MTFIVRLADKNIQINCHYPEFKQFCKDYIVENVTPDFAVSWTKEEIMAEQELTSEHQFSALYLETLTALRKISERMPKYRRILMHGASIAYHGNAFLFTAPSGTGKSTHIRLWRKYLGEEVEIVNGDKPFISLESEVPYIYGTPWAGKENWHKNHSAPLKGIVLVQRGITNQINKVKPADFLPFILKQVFLPNDPFTAGASLELIDCLLKKVPLYLLECDISEDAVCSSFEALTGLPYPHK